MIVFKNTLVIIPARGGSKRIPNKNIKVIFGNPMIYWPLIELKKLFKSEDILISTDSKIIKSIVEKKGIKVPFIRPKTLSDDFTGTDDVIFHALNWYENFYGLKVDYVLTVYPTAVLLSSQDLLIAFKTLKLNPKCDSIMSATSFAFPIQRAIFENDSGYAEMFQPQNYSKRSQDFVQAKHDAGQFYITKAKVIREKKSLLNSNVKLHLLKRNKVIDIDNQEDFEIAENKLKLYKSHLKDLDWNF